MADEVSETDLRTWGSGDEASRARRRGDTVLRDSGPWSTTVVGLLRHLEAVGFDGAPRVVGDGFSTDGREVVTFLPGSSPHPGPWRDAEALWHLGRLLRRAHDATASFPVPAGAVWQPWFGRSLGGDSPVIGHCDAGPWNVVARDGIPYALIDWEFAGPVDALWEVAHVGWLNAQLHDDDVAERVGLGSAADRAAQLAAFLEGYGLDEARRLEVVGKAVEVAVHEARAEAVAAAVGPESASAVGPTGYPAMWAVAWRARSASWMLRHRRLLERAVAPARSS